ncbi:MAG: VOC family protein [Acidimicrobiales bacterium]
MPAQIDHLVIAATDLAWLRRWWDERTGVHAVDGGAHDGRGTRNALVGLAGGVGATTYLELIGPDPEQPTPPEPRSFGIDDLPPEVPTFVTFAVSVDDLESAVATVASVGLTPGPIVAMSRLRPDGVRLSWRLAVPDLAEHGGAQPFLIEWGDTPHPSQSLPGGAELLELSVESPASEPLAAMFDALGLTIGVTPADRPMLNASIQTPNGVLDIGAA